jgi:hypothetical protein
LKISLLAGGAGWFNLQRTWGDLWHVCCLRWLAAVRPRTR